MYVCMVVAVFCRHLNLKTVVDKLMKFVGLIFAQTASQNVPKGFSEY